MKYIYYLLLFISPAVLNAQEVMSAGARVAGMSSAGSTIQDVWGIFNNQAGIAQSKNFECGIFSENLYLLPALSRGGLALSMPTKSGVLGLGFMTWGRNFGQRQLGLVYGKKMGKNVSFGVKLNYIQFQQPENYGNISGLTAEAGLQYDVQKNLRVGMHIYNPAGWVSNSSSPDRPLNVYKLGLQYTPSETVILYTEGVQNSMIGFSFKAGAEYKPSDGYQFRSGISTNPLSAGFGFSYNLKPFVLETSAHYTAVLGFSPRLSLIYTFKKEKKPEE